jgi:hypothetical protein
MVNGGEAVHGRSIWARRSSSLQRPQRSDEVDFECDEVNFDCDKVGFDCNENRSRSSKRFLIRDSKVILEGDHQQSKSRRHQERMDTVLELIMNSQAEMRGYQPRDD